MAHDLPGTSAFQNHIRQSIQAAQHNIKQVGLLIIDFDKPEESSADIGPRSYDFLEKQTWMRLRNALRDSDIVERLPDGEIAVLLPSVGGPDDAVVVAKKIVDKLAEPIVLEGLKFDLQPRIGIAMFPEHSTNTTTLLQRADAALRTARRTKNTYFLYTQDETNSHRSPLRMSELRQAIIADQLFLVYQPKIKLSTGRVSGTEVLTRWRHPQIGRIAPGEFIPVAERTGLIIPLTLWVLHQALLQCRYWNDSEIDVSVAVNLSMWNLEALELPEQISGLLSSINLSANKLELEITESAIMGDPQRAMRILMAIRDLGVRLTIDDFGTGYSSLAYLRKLPVTTIKIDKSFVYRMETDKDNAVIVRSIIDLGHNLGLKVVAEGVETREAVDMLTQFECDEVQGYYYSRPVTADKLTPFLARRTVTPQEAKTSGNNFQLICR